MSKATEQTPANASHQKSKDFFSFAGCTLSKIEKKKDF